MSKDRMTQFHLTQSVLYYCMLGISQAFCHEMDLQLQTSLYIIHKKASCIGIALALLAKAKLFSPHQKGLELRVLERFKQNEH